jgi:hypothetical protein
MFFLQTTAPIFAWQGVHPGNLTLIPGKASATVEFEASIARVAAALLALAVLI